ncbi:UDP-MurNac-tripeptide synthetase [Aquifex aeolicus VF5]|uniref:UDP-N-acetylmuramoyl-L-alanyl-D-glutamate--2,6-diaminopimelate ligase n=2 Tax=Aquifex aeolicus TaxID=63363 RepID=MURE_AQUAE|nr:RecName: Full=UDP-N-acetylmuramoyl-L-alanyl-D-glutamate--2,6-diaminopimelate ligase; AltName: Full=Meso-A2pm-adding enzyme; AltName: Full=Meso-diaminopimelate-adding enzyme; AltName: Full=UDP-MurNAc-L-Ala-D-Glu:meso-diaminopimelate ligase; AltName: Full=UDP-MurNAc-tripeptide synthetase; AltName: Full=UDP-N-acetylmuramyl-tripeptide synthetase [Aquifex aeolicus VF5]AAC07591.1 UDP-MurNac-tripeptide synthetase [Aquifex aeolicus VF5]
MGSNPTPSASVLYMDLSFILKRVKGITLNSKEVKKGYLFFAIKGTRFDGHNFIREAEERGAYAVVVERPVSSKVPVIIVEDTRKALGKSAHEFFGKPSERLNVIGITGTNGKTTTTHLIEKILLEAGEKTGLIGTIYYRLGEKILGSGRTTPDQITWHRTLKEFYELGAKNVVAEISSHALDQYRVYPTRFEAVLFTNLSQDHLDYHKTMEDYFASKAKLFTEYESKVKIINADDTYGKRLLKITHGEIITYGKKGDLKILNFRTDFRGSALRIAFKGKEYEFSTNLIGDFQAYNLSAAIAYALWKGIEPDLIQRALKCVNVPGRFEVVHSDKFTVIIDYAHTPDAVENVLRTARKLSKGKLISVFGAGGNRDREKRPLMGKAAEKYSDLIILTSDNPRDEEPEKIIEDILDGISEKDKVIIEADRRKAIKKAIDMAKEGDMVAILGKGHEDYQEIKGVKYPFSDAQVVKEILGGDGCIGKD